MAKFLTPLVVRARGEDLWELTEPLYYKSDLMVTPILVPAGFETDFASVPRAPFAYWIAGGIGESAAVIHDYLYRTGMVGRSMADKIFCEALGVLGQPKWRQRLMYLAVRWFAGGAFHRE